MMRVFSALVLVFSLVYTPGSQAQILPENDLHLRDNVAVTANITEEEFNEIVDEVVKFYKPYARKHGATLKGQKDWKDSTVNAYATQKGNTWIIKMFGGLARRPEVTKDGFALVACHEIGHHFAGYYLNSRWGGNWASVEGQSDYYATQVCARNIWGQDRRLNAKYKNKVNSYVKRKCDRVWKTTSDRNLCYRVAAAGKSLADLLSALRRDKRKPEFDTPDRTRVRKTNTKHPKAQCRLDTYFQGALCLADFDLSVIPGRRHREGQNSKAAEQQAGKYSCMRADSWNIGLRPRCWFKPLMEGPEGLEEGLGHAPGEEGYSL